MSGNVIHVNKSTQLQDANYDSPSAEYELVGSRPSPNKVLQFHNPMYSVTGPVTVSKYVTTSC